MPQLPFTPAPGLFTDTSGFSGKGGWIDCSNVRFFNGRWEVIGGQTLRSTSGASMSGTVNAILEWNSLAGIGHIAWATTSRLMIEKAGVLYNVTPTLSVSTPRWSLGNFGETLIANESGGKIWQWSLNTAAIALQVTNSPANVTCILVTPQRQLLALGCNEVVSGTFNGRCVRCSDLEDITVWTPTSTNNSDEIVLDGATSDIVTARMVGDYVAVWTSTELFLGTFIGDPGQTYRFERVGSNCGAVSLRSVVVVGSTAYWLAPDITFKAWSPGAEPQTVPCPIIEDWRSHFPTTSITADTFAAYVAKFNEVWFTCSNTGAQYFGRYVAFSVADGLWFKGFMYRRAMHQGLSGLLAAGVTNTLLTCESGNQAPGTLNTFGLQWYIQSSDIYLDSGQRRMMIRSMKVDFSGARLGNVSVTIYGRNYPNDSYTPGTPQVLATNTLKKDFRQSARLISVYFSGNDANATTDTWARQGQPVFDYVPTGER